MRKIWNRVRFYIMNRTEKSVELKGFRYVFKTYSMRVESQSKNFSLELLGSEHPFGYLAAADKQGKEGNLHGYAVIMYVLATSLTKDQKLVSDVEAAIRRYYQRMERVAEKAAKAKMKEQVSEEEEAAILLNEKNAYDKGRDNRKA